MATAADHEGIMTFVDRLGDLGAGSGMPRMAARVLGHLMTLDEGRATAAELADSLSASPAAISGAVRYLEQVGLVRRTRERGARRDVFVLDGDWADYITTGLEAIRVWSQVFAEGADALPAGLARERLSDNARLFGFLADELDALLRGWRERGQDSTDGSDSSLTT